jgi:hypothetical protein
MYDLLKEFMKPELFVLVPVLYLYGMALKKSTVPDKDIPWLLGVTSIVLCYLFICATSIINGWQEILMCIFTGITQGVLCAGASVYVNQLIKQHNKAE